MTPRRYSLHPARAEDAVSRVEVGEALHAVNPRASEEWVHWCMFRQPITSKHAVALMQVRSQLRDKRKSSGVLTPVHAHILLVQAKLARSSKRERVLLKTMWNGFVGAVQGGSEEQATQMRDAHRYIQHEKARCEALMREAERFGPVEAPDAEEQVPPPPHTHSHTLCCRGY